MIETNCLENDTISMMQIVSMPKEEKMRYLLNKFSTQKWIPVPSDEWEQFCELLKLNSLLKKPLDLSLDTWFFINEKSKLEWLKLHPNQEILDSNLFTDPDNFIEIAKEHHKVEERRGNSYLIHLPGTHFRPSVDVVKPLQPQNFEKNVELPSYLGKKKSIDKENLFNKKSAFNNATQFEDLSINSFSKSKDPSTPIFTNSDQTQTLPDAKILTPQKKAKKEKKNDSEIMIVDDDSKNLSKIEISSSPKKSKAISQTQIENRSLQKLKTDSIIVKKPFEVSSHILRAPPSSAYRSLYPVNVNVCPPGDDILKQAHSTMHQDMLRMTKRFDFFMHEFMKMEEDLQEMRTNFEKVVDFATRSLSRREKQALLTELKENAKNQKKKENNNSEAYQDSVKSDPDDDEYDKLIKREQLKQLRKQTNINTNIYTAEIDPSSRANTLTQWRKQTQLEISTQLQKSSELIDVPEMLRQQWKSSGERKVKAKDLKESKTDDIERQDFEYEPESKRKQENEDLVLDPETMLSMLAEDDSKDKKEEEKEERKRKRSNKKDSKTESIRTNNTMARPFDEMDEEGFEDDEIEPDLPDEDIELNDGKIGLFDNTQDFMGADLDEDMD